MRNSFFQRTKPSKPMQADLRHTGKILSIHHMLAMGETVLLSAPFNAIRANLPGVSISMIAGRYACGFLDRMHWADRAVPIDRFGIFMGNVSGLKRLLFRPFIVSRLSRFVRGHNFDCVFVRDDERLPYTRLIRTAVQRAGVRTVVSLQPLMEKHLVPSRHLVSGYFEILRDLGFEIDNERDFRPVLERERSSLDNAVGFLSRHGINKHAHKIIGLCPTSNLGIKNWSAHRTAGLHRLISRDPSIRVLLFTTVGEYIRQVAESSEYPPIMVGHQSFDNLVALISHCDIFISVDTGPLHVAAALGIPCVGIFGPTPGTMFGPYGTGHVVLQHTPECSFFSPESFFSSQEGEFQQCYVLDKCLHMQESCTNLVTEQEVFEQCHQLENKV